MRQTAHSKRRARHQARGPVASLNLVSLMDIFTILVFFLLINSGDIEILQTDDSLELPSSTSERTPEETLILAINTEAILLGGRPLIDLNDPASSAAATQSNWLQPLADELAYQAGRKTELSPREEKHGLAVTIMGDKSIPYTLLKSVIKVCTENNYRDIAMAVNQLPPAQPKTSLPTTQQQEG